MFLETKLHAILSSVSDSLLGFTAMQMGLTYDFVCKDKHLTLTLKAGFPTVLLQDIYIPALTAALQQAFPAYTIEILIDTHIKAHKTQMPGKGLKGVKNTIAIASGKGGVGKSTVTVNLALSLAKMGARVGILDADIYGPSIPLMLGKTEPVKIVNDKYLPVSAHGIYAMSIGYLTEQEQALIWRGPMLAKALLQMLDITLWEDLDYLLIDLPPGTGDIQLSLVQKIPLTAAIVVTTPQQIATLDAQKALTLFHKTDIEVLGVIENMAMYTCNQCHHQEFIFGQGGAAQLCEKNKCILLGQLPLETRIQEQCDTGLPEDALVTPFFIPLAFHAAIELAKKPLNYAHKFPDIVAV